MDGPEPHQETFSSHSEDEDVDPVTDIIEYLVRCAKVSFKIPHVNEGDLKTKDKLAMAYNLYKQSPLSFLSQYGKYLVPHHMTFFDNLPIPTDTEGELLRKCIEDLKIYHSDDVSRKRIRNRRYRALQKLQTESDYFSEKEMMFRNPLLYEQLVGQYLTDEEIQERDGADAENLTLVKMILDTVDRNEMRERKNIQLNSDSELTESSVSNEKAPKPGNTKLWGTFTTSDPKPTFQKREVRKQSMINAPEKRLLRTEFLQEMYNNFIDGLDTEFDYNRIDNDDQYDDLKQVSQDAEDKYFDSETNETENLEEHLHLTQEYGGSNTEKNDNADPLDTFMEHLNKRHCTV